MTPWDVERYEDHELASLVRRADVLDEVAHLRAAEMGDTSFPGEVA